jgi:hypothetical protein
MRVGTHCGCDAAAGNLDWRILVDPLSAVAHRAVLVVPAMFNVRYGGQHMSRGTGWTGKGLLCGAVIPFVIFKERSHYV